MLEPFSIVRKYYTCPSILNWMMRSSRILGMKPNFPNNKFSQEEEQGCRRLLENSTEEYNAWSKKEKIKSAPWKRDIDRIYWQGELSMNFVSSTQLEREDMSDFPVYTHQVPISSQKNKEGKRRKILTCELEFAWLNLQELHSDLSLQKNKIKHCRQQSLNFCL